MLFNDLVSKMLEDYIGRLAADLTRTCQQTGIDADKIGLNGEANFRRFGNRCARSNLKRLSFIMNKVFFQLFNL